MTKSLDISQSRFPNGVEGSKDDLEYVASNIHGKNPTRYEIYGILEKKVIKKGGYFILFLCQVSRTQRSNTVIWKSSVTMSRNALE